VATELHLTTQLTLSGCLNSWLPKCVTLVVSTKGILLLCSSLQNKRRLPGLDIVAYVFFTTNTTQNTLIKWKSDFWTYTTRHIDRAGSSLGRINEREANQGKVVTARPPTRLVQVRSSLLCLQRQVAKLASRLLYSWSLLRTNNTAINLQMFTSSYGTRRFAACDQGSH